MSKKKTKRSVSPIRKKSTKSLTRKQILDAAEAHSQQVTAKLARRDSDTSRIDTSIPAGVLDFLHALYESPPLEIPDGKDFWTDGRRIAAIVAALREAYSQGCAQGYIEGFVARREPHKQGSATGNAAKRKTLVELPDGRKITRDERDTLMVAEYESLLALKLKKTPAMDRLAGKYGLGGWQAVAKAIDGFRKRIGQ